MIDVTLRDRIGDLEDGFDSLNSELGEGPGVTTETVGGNGSGGGGGALILTGVTGGPVIFTGHYEEGGKTKEVTVLLPFCNGDGLSLPGELAAAVGFVRVVGGSH